MKQVDISIKRLYCLIENHFDNNIRYSLIKRLRGGGYKQIGNTEARCRDYFLDCIFVDRIYPEIKKDVSIYGYKYHQTGYLKRSRKSYLSIALQKKEFPKYEEAAKRIVEFLNYIETEFIGGLKPTIIREIIEETAYTKRYLLIADPVWKTIGPLHSLYTLLIQLGAQGYRNAAPDPFDLYNIRSYLGNITGHQWDTTISTKLGPQIIPLLIHERAEIFKTGVMSVYSAPRSMSVIHDTSGIYSLIIRAKNIGSRPSAPERNWYGGDWSSELAKFI